MAFLLELKEKIRKVYNKYDTYIVPAMKFIIAFVSFMMINGSIGYMAKLKNPLITKNGEIELKTSQSSSEVMMRFIVDTKGSAK